MKRYFGIVSNLFIMVVLSSLPYVIMAQEITSDQDSTQVDLNRLKSTEIDSLSSDSTVSHEALTLFDLNRLKSTEIDTVRPVSPISPAFKPNPTKAVLYSALFPGLGQIYNHKYWKLPIVYGGFMGFSYAIMWNNKNYQDYGNAYKDLTYDLINNKDKPDNWHQSWQYFIAAGVDPSTRFNENFRSQLKRGRDLYRRNRDLSIIMTVGFYLICMADAYVDAHLFDFDISPDLSLHVEPVVSPGLGYDNRLYGLNCSIKF